MLSIELAVNVSMPAAITQAAHRPSGASGDKAPPHRGQRRTAMVGISIAVSAESVR
jgi:hypothetical protein